MLRYILKRLGLMVVLLVGVSLMVFLISHLVPSDPAASNLSQTALADPEIVAAYKRHAENDTTDPSLIASHLASAAGIVAMKATTVPLRASSRPEKRASDLYDLGRLLVSGRVAAADLDAMPAPLRRAVLANVSRWFVDDAGRDRTYRDVRRFDEPRLDLDAVADAVEDLMM